MKMVEKIIVREIPVSPGVMFWNYWDVEHVPYVHKSFDFGAGSGCRLLYESKHCHISYLPTKLPIFSFVKSSALNVVIQHDANTIKIIYMGFFSIPSESTVTMTEIHKDLCTVRIHARFFLTGWRVLLAPFIDWMSDKWAWQIWNEDLPLRLRRQKVLRWGFQDFVGLPDRVADRHFSGEITNRSPLPRSKTVEIASWL